MIGFSPLASNPLGDDGGGVVNVELTAANVASQAPSVDNATLTQAHDLGATGFNTGSPLLQTTSLTQSHTLASIALTFGTPVLGGPSITQEHDLTVTGVATGNPVVDQVTMAEDETFATTSVETGTPDVDNPDLTQDHSFNVVSFITGVPVPQTTSVTQDHSLTIANIDFGSPTLGSPDYDEESVLTPDNLTAQQPTLGNPAVSSSSVLQPDDIITLIPDVEEPVDPNAIIAQEIKEIEQMFGGWPRRAYEVPDGRLVQGEREIEATFGDRVSVDRKAKSLIKFGKSADLVADRLETVWTVGGNETYVTDNTIEYISSSSAADTQTIKIECHTVSGTGADTKFTFLVQEVTLDGQNPVALDTPVARVSHAYNTSGTELVGRVTVYENTTVVGGVPSDETKIHIDIPQGLQGSLKGATTFSDSDYYILTGGFGSVSKKQTAAVDFYLEVRTAGGVFIQQAAISATTGGPWDIDLDPAVIIPKNADVRITAESGTNNAHVFGVFKGYLAKVLN
jgi:hypothetical protein